MASPLGSSALISPEANAAEQSRKELQAKLTGLGGLNGRNLSAEAKEKKLREACEGFESIFIQKMWQEMRNTIPKGGMMHGKEERFWQDMYDQELSKSMTRAGGIGLADMMYEQLSRGLVSASRSAAGMAQGAAFTPSAAPLVPAYQPGVQDTPAESQELAANSIYEGQAPQIAGNAMEDGEADTARDNSAETAGPGVKAAEPAPAAPQPEAAQAVATAPVAPVSRPEADSAAAPARKHTIKKADLNNSSGLEMAYMARREAGDKLGSRAVRPALHQKREPHVEKTPQPVAEAAPQDARPGSPEALAAAIKLARAGSEAPAKEAGESLTGLVARVKAQNASAQAAMQATAPQAAAESVESDEAPVVRKVRYSTNMPSKNKSKKNSSQAIRMLNVDNVGVNSKAGQGIAAYHAAQLNAEAQPQPVAAPEQVQPAAAAQPAQPIAPLTARQVSAEMPDNGASFSIPPLTAGGLNG